MDIKVSIVTVSYNEVQSIERTLNSVSNQTYANVEHIVVDGGSLDGTVNIIKRYECLWSSEKDGGIYFGMNKGLDKCTGDYVIFCNAGDEFTSNDVIERMVAVAYEKKFPDLLFGDCASEVNGKVLIRRAHGPGFVRFGMPAAHEAMMYKLPLIKEHNLHYDTSYRIAADYKFTYEFLNCAKTSARLDFPIVKFFDGGVSTANKWSGLQEACRVRCEVGKLSFLQRLNIWVLQSGALVMSTYAAPVYRVIRMRKG